MGSVINKINPVWFVAIILFIIPFFWFTPGAIDIGGDGNRLYFYDPLTFLENVTIYSIEPEGKGNVEHRHYLLIYVSFIALINHFINSPHFLVAIFNGIKLSVGFLSIYFIVKEFIYRDEDKNKRIFMLEISAVLSGVFYILVTGSEKLISLWDKALFPHDQLFLNPLIFLLVFRYFLTNKVRYLFLTLFISFIFSTNFSVIAAPQVFAFYPLGLLFLLIYIVKIKKRKIILKPIFLTILFFLGLQAFHIISEIASVLDSGSAINNRVFNDIHGQVNYFMAVHGFAKVSTSFFLPSPDVSLRWTSFLAPLIILLGYLLHKKNNKEVLLTSIFFLITFFLVTANITDIGLEAYRRLFYIPGFNMFRNFYIQWAYIFIFFYTLLFGQSLVAILTRLKTRYSKSIATLIFLLFIIGSWPFLNGELINPVQWGSNGVKTAVVMDPRYEQTLEFIRKLPDEGKIVLFPLTSYYHQIIYGTNNAAYVGPTSISYLTPKKSFAGYQNFYPYPIPEDMMQFSREKKFDELTQIFSLFNIRYIFHNTDPKIYEEKFPLFPNDYMMTGFPKTQKEYKKFVQNFPVRQIYKNGPYEIFEFDKKTYRREIYIPDVIYRADMIDIISKQKVSSQSAFIDKIQCQKSAAISDFCKKTYNPPKVSVLTEKINTTEYILHIKQSESSSPFLLVFQNSFHPEWKLKFDHENSISEDKHVLVNKYANGWIIDSDERKGKNEYSLLLTLETQKYFWYGLYITGFSLIVFLGVVVFMIKKKKNV